VPSDSSKFASSQKLNNLLLSFCLGSSEGELGEYQQLHRVR